MTQYLTITLILCLHGSQSACENMSLEVKNDLLINCFLFFFFVHIEISSALYVIIRNWKMCQNACVFQDWCPV